MTQHRTSIMEECKIVAVNPNQKRYWVEFQLLDEQGEPVANMPYRAVNDATRCNHIEEYTGQSDASGVIRVEDLHRLDLTLFISAQPLADEMEQRKLRVSRDVNQSKVKAKAQQESYEYHYVRIGELCDKLPNITPAWKDKKNPPKYHFPDSAFSGFTVKKLDCRHVLEVCPFRAWSPWLKHTQEYNLVNAYNLSLMAILVYADNQKNEELITHGSVQDFFFTQLLDLKQLPNKVNSQYFPLVAHDVPFSQRYTRAEFIDTSKNRESRGDTQMFYASNQTEAIVAWRGTAGGADIASDANGVPVNTLDIIDLSGNVHNGFKNAFIATELNVTDSESYKAFSTALSGKKVYLCGHSLGGALALIHSAYIKTRMDFEILLYTYGMPRAFTHSITEKLTFPHYRHVNNRDTITSVPWPGLGRIYYTELIKLALKVSSPVLTTLDSSGVKPLDYSHHGHLVHFKSVDFQMYIKGRPATKSWVGQEIKLMLPLSLAGGVDNAKIHQDILELYQAEGQDNPTDFKVAPTDHSSTNYANYLYTRLTALICEKYSDQNNAWLQQRAKAESYKPFYGGEAAWHPLLVWDESLIKYQSTLLGTDDSYLMAEQRFMAQYYATAGSGLSKQDLDRDITESQQELLEQKQKYATTYNNTEKQVRTIYNSTNKVEVPVGEGKKLLDEISGDITSIESNISKLQGNI
ncbi:lipase family protein [Serratia oryzae]|uniref:Fungal lipase-type domain-containing protein n=1 Tax=Serratia oryzae TaxID=2034155 RepID=A0A1S8CKX4_9GAMM|nr:lipase family protein [Serratia oryzae]OMQ24593.1 hypothetical protein BMI79_07150 [Serratia oryzae]